MAVPFVGSLASSRTAVSRQALNCSTTGRVTGPVRVALRARASNAAANHSPAVFTGALTAAALTCVSVSPATSRHRRSVVARASGESTRIADSVFNVSTEKLPGGDKLTNEGILGFFIAGFFAVWLGGTAVKTFAVMIGFFFTAAKSFAMGIALVLIGIAAS